MMNGELSSFWNAPVARMFMALCAILTVFVFFLLSASLCFKVLALAILKEKLWPCKHKSRAT